MRIEAKYFPDLDALSLEAANLIAQRVKEKVGKGRIFTLVLSGGSTPRRLYEILSRPPFLTEIPWGRIHFFWGDERCVPPDHPESNYRLANRSLLAGIQLPKANIHRILVEKGQGPWAAKEYEMEILAFFNSFYRPTRESATSKQKNPLPPPSPKGGGIKLKIPAFDLVLLGLGKDGHTASLFPGDPALTEKEHLSAYVPEPGLPPDLPRVTMTLPVINQAEKVIFLVSGEEKREIVRTILEDPSKAQERYPAARVRPRGKLFWFIA
jgi:6-phosphogluconolactonase